jgi:hypothetical protein
MSEEQQKRLPYKRRLLELLPTVLPASPEDALTGTELVAKLRQIGFLDGKDASLHSWFSSFAKDPTTPIARVANRNGYFLRLFEGSSFTSDNEQPTEVTDSAGRDVQLEEKFRALYIKWCQSQGQFPVLLNHNEGAKRPSGINRWKYPDVISLQWNVLHAESAEEFDENTLDVMQGLGEPPFELISSELKVDLRPSNLREAFFQCVSNSRWAHMAQLVVASAISDDSVVAELARLGPSYEVTVLSFGLTADILRELPSADKIRIMTAQEADPLLQKISVQAIATGGSDDQIDWEQLRDLQKQHDTVDDILEWIARCLKDKQPHSFDAWSKNLKKKKKR